MMNPITDQKPIMLRVIEKKIESPEFATLFFEYAIPFKPGQFVMVWIPGIDEKPYTISYHSKNQFAITIEAKGLFSKKAITLDKGDLVGIRGPFGNGFEIQSKKHVGVVAGGCGMAPLATLAEQLDKNTTFIHGARTKDYILYPDRFDIDRQFCTDDGSFGHKGFVTDILEKEIASGKLFDMIYACGPEIMMYTVFKICEKHQIPCQISLERYMRCGFGVCGACVCGKQIVCKDGPVFNSAVLRDMKDFNTKALLKSGKDVDLSLYFSWRCK
ncbi:MAG: dihydroorotate dehydrogenase electron transfer subunit [Desulfobacteraceae bacterium]|nr:dihydroorotate dehydrogenase electron transfer subunit [Desulfobacteraceae bacterium]